MKLRINIYIIISATLFLVTLSAFYIFSTIFEEMLIFYLGIPFAIATLFLFLNLLCRLEKRIRLKTLFSVPKFVSCITCALLFAVIFIPAFEGIALNWIDVPPLSLIRYLASIAVTLFLPGYFLLRILDRENSIKDYMVIVLSYLLSLFITFLTGFFILVSGNSISSLGNPVTVGVCLFLMIIYLISYWKADDRLILTLNWFKVALIIAIFAVVMLGSITIMLETMPLRKGDMSMHHGLILQFVDRFPRYITYPYLFHVCMAVLLELSGIPLALAEQGLFFISFIPVLAFYSAVKLWFHREHGEVSEVALFFSILLGFGGLYALCRKLLLPSSSMESLLRVTTSKTYDINMRFLYLPDNVAPIFLIGLPVFFALLYFLKKKNDNFLTALIISLLVAVGYMGHIAEVIFFVFVLLIYAISLRQNNDPKIGLYIMFGLLLVSMLDLVAPTQTYVGIRSGTILSCMVLAILATIIELVKDKKSMQFPQKIKIQITVGFEKLWKYAKWVLLYSYMFLVVIWLAVEETFDLWAWGSCSFTPFFVLPIRFGPVGLLTILIICAYLPVLLKDRKLSFFLSLVALGFILEQLANYSSFIFYPSYRYGTLTFVGGCIIASYGVVNILSKKGISQFSSVKRKVIFCVLLIPLILFGFLSTTLYYINASIYHGSGLQIDELDALRYIQQNIPANASVLTFTRKSANNLRNFAGISAPQDAQRWSKLLSTSNPYIITHILSSSNIKYIYVAQRDVKLLNACRLGFFVKYFSKIFTNDHVSIYEVPSLTPPSSKASIGVLHFSSLFQKIKSAIWIDDSFTEGWYSYRQFGEVKSYESEAKDGIMKISVTSNQSGTVWVSYASSGLSLNTTTYSTLSFRYRVNNNLTWFTLQLWNSTNQVFLYVGHLSSTNFTTKTFALPKNQTVTRIEIITETAKDAPVGAVACTYIDYIKFSAPISSWKEDNFLSDWEFYETYGNISDYSARFNGDILEINVTSNQRGTVWASYSLPLNLKTKDSVLSFLYKVNNNYTWFTIILQNSTHRFFFYRGRLTDRFFTAKSYPLPDGQTITRIEIIVETTDKAPPQTSAIAQIDYIEISKQPFSEKDVLPALFVSLLHSNYTTLYVDDLLIENIGIYLSNFTHIILPSDPQLPMEDILKWVSAGNTLTVFNIHGNGFFANLLGINASSPILSINKIASGKILYINLLPKIAVGKEADIFQPDLLKEVKTLLALEESIQKIDVLPVYNSTFGGIYVRGDLNVTTNILMLQGAINMSNSPFSVNESKEIKMYGDITFLIKNATLSIFPSESYMLIKPDDYPIEGEILIHASRPALITINESVIYNSNRSISFKFSSTGISAYARLPSISATGTITFDQLDVHAALYVPLAGIVQQRAEIQGNVKFDTMYISTPITIFSIFQAEGKILKLAETARPTISWVEVLFSPYNIAFNTIFFLSGVAIHAVKKRKAKIIVDIENYKG
jgi:hypothetical protein